jgi:hypothetical protein
MAVGLIPAAEPADTEMVSRLGMARTPWVFEDHDGASINTPDACISLGRG